MAQQNIDFGTFPDDPDADAIRTAFSKVQQNFTEIYNGFAGGSVVSVNRTPGAGITVSSPTGNVIITANIACVQVHTSTLSIGRDANGLQDTSITSSSQTLWIDLPATIANVDNIELDGYANVAGALNVLGLSTLANLVVSSTANVTGNLNVTGNFDVDGTSFLTHANVSGNLVSTGNLLGTGNVSFTGANVSLGAVGNLRITGGS
jgi:hypothetical protein